MRGGGTFLRTCEYLDLAQSFHQDIAQTFHPNSYAHYGADRDQRSFAEIIWEIDGNCVDPTGWNNWPILSDTRQGTIELVRWTPTGDNRALKPVDDEIPNSIYAKILPPTAVGDQTVPAKSADHQLRSKVFQGIFRQSGYEHQSSYKNQRAISSTLYSIVRIAQKAEWKC